MNSKQLFENETSAPDETENRVLIFGGGNVPKSADAATKKGGSFGFGDRTQLLKRVLVLQQSTDSMDKEEWKWCGLPSIELPSDDCRLPHRTGWSACMIDHKVYLFGGRVDEKFFNDVYVVQLHRDLDLFPTVIRRKAEDLRDLVSHLSCNHAIEARNVVWEALSDCISPRSDIPDPLIPLDGRFCLNQLRIFSLNVHGWSTFDRKHLIDDHVRDLALQYSPDVVCLQEVKYTMPSIPSGANKVVRIVPTFQQNFNLFRYHESDSDNEIIQRLHQIDSRLPEYNSKLISKAGDMPYLEKGYGSDDLEPSLKDYKYPTSLESVSSVLKGSFCFAPALDQSFGNAVIASSALKNKGTFEHFNITEAEEESRSASFFRINQPHCWNLVVVCTHLDAKSENTRKKQLEKLFEKLRFHGVSSVPHILCGDFNSLSYWTEKQGLERLKFHIEPATRVLYSWLTEELGYLDLELLPTPRPTCHYDTRVDYILCSPALRNRLDLSLTKLFVQDTESDHRLLLANLRFNKCKLLIGITGPSCAGKTSLAKKAAKDIRNSSVVSVDEFRKKKQECPVTRNFYNRDCSSAYDVDEFSRKVFDEMSKFDVVLAEGLHVCKLLPSLDRLFVICVSSNECLRRRKGQNRKPTAFCEEPNLYWEENYWHEIAEPQWKEHMGIIEEFGRGIVTKYKDSEPALKDLVDFATKR